jgi:cystathionine beta-lyase/cystathionine gamma-synthase
MSGRSDKTSATASTPLAPALYPSSVYVMADLSVHDRIQEGAEAGFIYARDAHPNAKLLGDQMTAAEKAEWAVVCGSGMGSISACVLGVLKGGDRLVASDRLYGKTARLFREELPRLGVQTTYVDITELDEVRRSLDSGARMMFVETISNPLLRVADIPALAQLAHAQGCVLAVDNTFATPVLCRPLELGADLVIESLTKLIGGHSDLTLGVVCGRGNLRSRLETLVSTWGLTAHPFDCWLASRSLETLSLRVERACANAAELANWLVETGGIVNVVYPGRADHPEHKLAARLFSGCFGNMLCMELAGGREAVNQFFRSAPGLPFSPSLGHTSTTASHPATTSHRSMSLEDKARQGIGDGLIRLSVGIEDLTNTKAEIRKGLAR